MKDAVGIQWLLLFLSQLIFSPLVQILVYKYVAVTQGWIVPEVGFFRSLLFMYLIPFLIGLIVFLYTLIAKFKDINSGPFYMKIRQIVVLSSLSVLAIVFDYVAVVSYSAFGAIELNL